MCKLQKLLPLLVICLLLAACATKEQPVSATAPTGADEPTGETLPQWAEWGLKEARHWFDEPESRDLTIGEITEVEGEPCLRLTAEGLLQEGRYPLAELAVGSDGYPAFYLNGEGVWVQLSIYPHFTCATSPDGSMRAESYGPGRLGGSSGLQKMDERRIISTATGEVLWSAEGGCENLFYWSPDGRYVTSECGDRTWASTEVVDTADWRAIPLPGIEALQRLDSELPGMQNGRGDPRFQLEEWVDDTTLDVRFSWNPGEEWGWTYIDGRYRYNLADGGLELLSWNRDQLLAATEQAALPLDEPLDTQAALELAQSWFVQEQENRVLTVGGVVEIEGQPCRLLTAEGLLQQERYALGEFALSPDRRPHYYKDEQGGWVAFSTRPLFTCVTSPDGTLRAEAFGIGEGSSGGLGAILEGRILSTDSGKVLWSGMGASGGFSWSPDSRYVTIGYGNPTWHETEVVDTRDMSTIALPGTEELCRLDPALPPPQAYRFGPHFFAWGWEDERTLAITFFWYAGEEDHWRTVEGIYYVSMDDGSTSIVESTIKEGLWDRGAEP